MKKIYSTLLFALMSLTVFAQEQTDTTYVMLDFNLNPWNYPVGEVTKGWNPDYTDWDAPGAILNDQDFSWSIADGSADKVKVTAYSVDLDEYSKVPYYASYELNNAETAALGIAAGKTNMLYMTNGSSIRFEAPAGYQFGKMVFYNFHNANFLVGDEYEEEYPYEYDGSTFSQKLKVWTPASPNKNQYDYNIWEGDAKNILFNYPYFSAVFVKIDIRLVSDGTSGIEEVSQQPIANSQQPSYTLDGRRIANGQQPTAKGLYIVNGKKHVVK